MARRPDAAQARRAGRGAGRGAGVPPRPGQHVRHGPGARDRRRARDALSNAMTRGAGGVAYAMICGSGSAGHVWEPVARALDGIVLPVPLEPDVPAMAAVLRPDVEALARPRVVMGTSLGALIALEL